MVRTVRKGFGENRKELARYAEVAERFGAWRPMPEVLVEVEAVPTIFLQYDLATGVGGQPIARTTFVHGPENEGKSEFALGLGASFLREGHYFGLVDAERTTPPAWVREMLREQAESERFLALPVTHYEGVVDEIERLFEGVAEARIKRRIPERTTALVVVDSLARLTPKQYFKTVSQALEKDAGKKQKLKDRSGQILAALNSAFMRRVTGLLADTRCALVLIGREYENPDAGFYEKDYVVAGGRGPRYESSLRLRMLRSWTKVGGDEESKGDANVVGERHRIEIHKTKIARKQARVPTAHYHTSNGKLAPPGFDRPRDALELALGAGLAELKGSWVVWEGRRLGQGKENAIARLHGDRELFASFEADVRRFVAENIRPEPAAKQRA